MSHSPAADRFKVTLSRNLTLFDITMIGVGAMIGAGIFGLTGLAAGEAGPVGLMLAFLFNGIVTSLTGLSYAELGAARPAAGGGYVWAKEALARIYGFYAGWISWFSHAVACSLYGVLFGTFFTELLEIAGIPISTNPAIFGLTHEAIWVKIVAALAVLLFMVINIRGSSETGAVGNIITIFKLIVLGALVVFGVKAIFNFPNWADNFLRDPNPLPFGLGGVTLAMGLTFVAFEGYEVIIQSAEEVKNPVRNIPKAIFLSIGVVVVVYLSVAFVAIGALQQDSGLPNWMYMGENGERAMIETARAIMPYGALVMVLGGLASSTSALNATIFSSSRVSFAMGRDNDLPAIFGKIHPRNKTPYWAIWLSGALIIFMAVALPISDVASSASITFLLLFLLVNFAMLRMRKTHPDMERPFRVPFVPYVQYLAIAIQLFLAAHLFSLSPVAWIVTVVWLALGVVVYRRYGGKIEAKKEEDTILMEETIASKEYSVLVPVANIAAVPELADLGALFAQANDGELFGLNVVYLPHQMSVIDGRKFLRQGRPILDEVVAVGRKYDVPVRTMIRIGRDIGDSIISAARDRDANLMILGWPEHTAHNKEAFGTIIRLISKNPPCDLAVVRHRHHKTVQSILVPAAGGPNARLALKLALIEAEALEEKTGTPVKIVALNIAPGLDMADSATVDARRKRVLDDINLPNLPFELEIIAADDVVEGILSYANGFDQLIIGASNEGLLEQTFFGSIPEKIAREALTTVIMVKEHDMVKYGIRDWLTRRNRRKKVAETS